MKILHIINTLAIGGAQSVLLQLIENWGESRDPQMVISLRKREQLSAWIEALGIPLAHIDLSPGKFDPVKFANLVRIIKDYRPDVIQTWLYHADLLGSPPSRLANRTPVIWGIHHTMTDRHSVKFSTWFVVKVLSFFSKVLPAHIICCSHSAFQTHVDFGYDVTKMSTVVNGVNTDHFRLDPTARVSVKNELELAQKTRLIGMFARFHPQKDHVTFIRAAEMLLLEKSDVCFVLAGEGVDTANEYLRTEINRRGMQDHFRLLGSRQDMPRLYSSMDIVTLSSAFGEALPMTLCEAMACGTPCVATNIGDTASLIEQTGRVVAPKNPGALASAWKDVLDLSAMDYNQLCFQAKQKVFASYNLPDMLSSYKRIYRKFSSPQ